MVFWSLRVIGCRVLHSSHRFVRDQASPFHQKRRRNTPSVWDLFSLMDVFRTNGPHRRTCVVPPPMCNGMLTIVRERTTESTRCRHFDVVVYASDTRHSLTVVTGIYFERQRHGGERLALD
ncbi:hypothetical protein KIN20_008345 [Parelaphostrongylus tenuis]|uniref:Uncharacterized protein n=1 Tax=Parelaphostrongylus tenuis TaxID=148309 RepID=A0AAD5M9N2_PARTN|nr:hypothetical protein KIN20_008345 [Parelaphostrongylus tenuis]